MDDSIIYIRAPFSLDRDFASSGEFVEDARAILALQDVQVREISEALEHHTGFLDSDAIKSLVVPQVDDEEQRERLARFITFLDKMFAQSGKLANDFVENVRKRLAEQSAGTFSDGDLLSLTERISALIKDQPGFKRQRKAERLYDEIGIPVRDLKIICDLRPVFDKKHTSVEGMILVTTLKVAAIDVDGLPITLQAKLTEKQVADLAEKAGEARQKLSVLRHLMEEKDLPMPFSGK